MTSPIALSECRFRLTIIRSVVERRVSIDEIVAHEGRPASVEKSPVTRITTHTAIDISGINE